MAQINKKHKWDTCIHALCPFGNGFALCSYGIKLTGELKAKDFPICMRDGKCRKEEAEKKEREV